MAASETIIANLALYRMGQSTIDDIDGTDTLSVKVNAIYDQSRDELQTEGPELGWKFCRRRYNGIDQESITITSIADSSTDGDITITGTHALVVGDMVQLSGDTGYDETYDVTAISTTATFDVTATFVATGTGTANWRSEDYAYRYLIPTTPTVLSVRSVGVGGLDVTDWLEEGGYILTNLEDEEIDMLIVQQITTTTKFPAWFTKALVLKIAIELHYNLTSDLKAIQLLEFNLDRAMNKAIAMDERGKYVQEASQSWEEVGNTMEVLDGRTPYPYFKLPYGNRR